MPKEFEDRVFGRLQFSDTFWRGWAGTRTLGGAVELCVATAVEPWIPSEGELPTENQRQAYLYFLANEAGIVAAVDEALLGYYRSIRHALADVEGLPCDPRTAAEMRMLLSEPCVFVPVQRGDGPVIILQWACAWDEERGVEVVVVGGSVTHVDRVGESGLY